MKTRQSVLTKLYSQAILLFTPQDQLVVVVLHWYSMTPTRQNVWRLETIQMSSIKLYLSPSEPIICMWPLSTYRLGYFHLISVSSLVICWVNCFFFRSGRHVIVSDFNSRINDPNDIHAAKFKILIEQLNLIQYVSIPTHGNTHDLVLTRDDLSVS